MKERPIIFSAPMVRAILEGRKSQTRRVMKPQIESARIVGGDGIVLYAGLALPKKPEGWTLWPNGKEEILARCPYGKPGDRLWVREAWQAFFADEVPADRPRGPRHTMGIPAQPERESFVFYRADGDLSHPEDGSEALWRPSIHMPRWASRLTLEIVSVRVEMVQEISEEDATEEGALEFDSPTTFVDHGMQSIYLPSMGYARASFMRLWDSINAKRAPWDSNPWVWVIEFRRAGE